MTRISRTVWSGAAAIATLLLGVVGRNGVSATLKSFCATWSNYGGTADSGPERPLAAKDWKPEAQG